MDAKPAITQGTEAVARLRELTKKIRTAMVTTVADDGSLHSRPMATHEMEDDGTLWFFTADDSGKAHEVARESHVNIAYADPGKDAYVSVCGSASVVRDREKAKELWTPWVKAYFPQGLDDPQLALLRVTVRSAAYWDVKESKMVQLAKMAKAALTGKQPDLGEHGKIDMPLRRP